VISQQEAVGSRQFADEDKLIKTSGVLKMPEVFYCGNVKTNSVNLNVSK